eukprot:4570126-Prymnesium_polylepis.1
MWRGGAREVGADEGRGENGVRAQAEGSNGVRVKGEGRMGCVRRAKGGWGACEGRPWRDGVRGALRLQQRRIRLEDVAEVQLDSSGHREPPRQQPPPRRPMRPLRRSAAAIVAQRGSAAAAHLATDLTAG